MSPKKPPSFQFQKVRFHAMTLTEATQWLSQAVDQFTRGYICFANVYSIGIANEDSHFREILNNALLTTTDGIPCVWAGKFLGFKQITRVYGPDLMTELCRITPSHIKHYFYGGLPGVAESLKTQLTQQFPNLNVAAIDTPPLTPHSEKDWAHFQNTIEARQIQIVWVGLGTPKQERFMAEAAQRINKPVLFLGVGAAFDFLSGHKPQAPKWIQRCGLEWAFRLACEPKRLAKRYLRYNFLFLIRCLSANQR